MDPKELKRIKKQVFLRKSILEHKYNKDVFIDFIRRHKQGGEDVDLWSEDELTNLVDNFKRTPCVYFERNKLEDHLTNYQALKITLEKQGCFKIFVIELEQEVVRNYEDLLWTFDVVARENCVINLVKPPATSLMIDPAKNTIRAENLVALKMYSEYLYIYFFGTDSIAITNFFTISEEEYREFRKVI
jgi:hypothetical protein